MHFPQPAGPGSLPLLVKKTPVLYENMNNLLKHSDKEFLLACSVNIDI